MPVLKQAGLKKQEPTLTGLRVDLARASLALQWLFRGPVTPECVIVNDGECAVALLGYQDEQRLALVMNEIVCLTQRLPRRSPALAINFYEAHAPSHRIVFR